MILFIYLFYGVFICLFYTFPAYILQFKFDDENLQSDNNKEGMIFYMMHIDNNNNLFHIYFQIRFEQEVVGLGFYQHNK